jgi:hypothetical protein
MAAGKRVSAINSKTEEIAPNTLSIPGQRHSPYQIIF